MMADSDSNSNMEPSETTQLKMPLNESQIDNDDDYDDIKLKDTFKNWNYETFKKRIPYYIPIVGWLPKYKKSYLFDDFVAGMTVSFVMIPQALGLSGLAFLPPVYGLYTAFLPLILYAFLGTSKHLSVGPEAAISLMTGQILYGMGVEEIDFPGIANTICFFSGLVALVAGICRLGYLDSILSKPMANGFITAVACVIMVEQMLNLFGISEHWDENDSAILKFYFVLENLGKANPYTCAIGIPGLAFLFIFNYTKNKFPSSKVLKLFPFVLFLVIISILISYGFDLESKSVVVLGDIEGGFQTPGQFKFEHTGEIIVGAILIAIVGFIESVVCAKKFADKNGYGISDNRELVALGTANTIGGLFGAYPANGALSRTNLNDAVGGKTQMASLITAVVILFTILFLLPLFYHLPKCIMAAVVFFAGFGLLEVDTLLFLIKIRAYGDIFLFFMTLAVTLGVNIQVGVLTSIGVSLGLVVKEVTGPTFNVIGKAPDGKYKPIEDGNDIKTYADVIIVRFKDSLFYAKIGFLRDKLRRVEKYRTAYAHPSENYEPKPLIAVVFDVSRMRTIDASALKLMCEIVKDYTSKGIRVCFIKLVPENNKKFKLCGLTGMVGEENYFPKIQDAMISINLTRSNQRADSIYSTGDQ